MQYLVGKYVLMFIETAIFFRKTNKQASDRWKGMQKCFNPFLRVTLILRLHFKEDVYFDSDSYILTNILSPASNRRKWLESPQNPLARVTLNLQLYKNKICLMSYKILSAWAEYLYPRLFTKHIQRYLKKQKMKKVKRKSPTKKINKPTPNLNSLKFNKVRPHTIWKWPVNLSSALTTYALFKKPIKTSRPSHNSPYIPSLNQKFICATFSSENYKRLESPSGFLPLLFLLRKPRTVHSSWCSVDIWDCKMDGKQTTNGKV